MTCRIEHARGSDWRYCSDDPAVAAAAIVVVHVTDEITGHAPTDLRLTSSRRDMRPRMSDDGVIGLVGEPARIFSAGPLVDVEVTVRAAGYVPWIETVTIDASNLPAERDVGLHRRGARAVGRVVERSGPSYTPLAGAVVTLDGYWMVAPTDDPPPPPHAPLVLGLAAPAYAGRSAGDALLRCDMALDLAQPKTLLVPAPRGADRIVVSDQLGLGSGIVAIQHGHPDLVEYVSIASVHGYSTPDQPATVFLAHSLAHAHRRGADVAPATPLPSVTVNTLARELIAGDACVFLTGFSPDLAGAAVVQIGSAHPEFQVVRRYQATADADGTYRLPPISRVARVRLDIAHAAIAPMNDADKPTPSVDYQAHDFRFDFISL